MAMVLTSNWIEAERSIVGLDTLKNNKHNKI